MEPLGTPAVRQGRDLPLPKTPRDVLPATTRRWREPETPTMFRRAPRGNLDPLRRVPRKISFGVQAALSLRQAFKKVGFAPDSPSKTSSLLCFLFFLRRHAAKSGRAQTRQLPKTHLLIRTESATPFTPPPRPAKNNLLCGCVCALIIPVCA